MCGLYGAFVGQLHKDTVTGRYFVLAGVVDLQEVSGASCVGNGGLVVWEWATEVGLIVVAIVYTMVTGNVSILPDGSHDFLFVRFAAIHNVATIGIALVAGGGEKAALAGVVDGYVISVRPAIIGILEFSCVAVACWVVAASGAAWARDAMVAL